MTTSAFAIVNAGWASGDLPETLASRGSSDKPVLGPSSGVDPPKDESSLGAACSVELSRVTIAVPARKAIATAAMVSHAVPCALGAARCRVPRCTGMSGIGAG